MKKLLCLLLAALMMFTLTACAQKPESSFPSSDTSEAVSEISEPADEITSQPEEITSQPNAPPAGESEDTNVSTSEQTKPETPASEPESTSPSLPEIDENGSYTSKDDVALYIHTFGHLPQNFITKKEAQNLGWSGGALEPYAPGKCIGGSHFGNYEGLLPEKDGRSYTECDIDTLGKDSRGAKRIVFSNDGLIYYTDDHYESFTLLYGEE